MFRWLVLVGQVPRTRFGCVCAVLLALLKHPLHRPSMAGSLNQLISQPKNGNS